jgi:hypothetical protein
VNHTDVLPGIRASDRVALLARSAASGRPSVRMSAVSSGEVQPEETEPVGEEIRVALRLLATGAPDHQVESAWGIRSSPGSQNEGRPPPNSRRCSPMPPVPFP